MVSPELLRRFPIFGCITMDNISELAKCAEEKTIQGDQIINREGDELRYLYLLLEGEVAIVSFLPKNGDEVVHSTIGVGELFNWSALIPPHTATASTKTIAPSRVVAFDAVVLRQKFTDDCAFGYQMVLNIAQVIRDRLNALLIETMAYHVKP